MYDLDRLPIFPRYHGQRLWRRRTAQSFGAPAGSPVTIAMDDLPGSVLFACSANSVRSPMAEAILKHLLGHRIFVDSVGVHGREVDGFAVAVMQEIGIDLSRHRPKTFDELQDSSFDLVITLSPDAQHKAVEMTRTMACDVEFWNMLDPTIVEGSRETRLEAYREVRDQLMARIKERFPMPLKPV
jgi:protein-tyrosine-phosphatase